MKFYLITLGFILNLNIGLAQNCNSFLYEGDTLQYEACKMTGQAKFFYQFEKGYQQVYDNAITVCPYFATAYHAKSVAYLKSGDFVSWKELMDEAVRLKPKDYLGYRGWCRYQFVRDYKGAIEDIEQLDELIDYDLGYSSNGDYHLNIVKGLCYKGLGESSKAINIIKQQIETENYSVGKYDLLHLGILYLDDGSFEKAHDIFKLQEKENNLAECHYYLAKLYKKKKDFEKSKEHLLLARDYYTKGFKVFDPYTEPMDKIYLKQIEEELIQLK